MLEAHPLRFNVGAGNKRIPGYVSVDIDGNADITADIASLPVPDDCADEVMAIHVLEHVHVWEAPAVVSEWLRILKPGGALVLELPDFLKCCRNVAAGMPHQMGMQGIYGDSSLQNPLMMHKWGWTPADVIRLLNSAGYIKAREFAPKFHGKRLNRDMRVEARKPC